MVVMLGLGLGLLIGGLAVMWMSPAARYQTLVVVVWWIGVVLVVFGVILLVTPAMVWIYEQVQSIVGGGRQIR